MLGRFVHFAISNRYSSQWTASTCFPSCLLPPMSEGPTSLCSEKQRQAKSTYFGNRSIRDRYFLSLRDFGLLIRWSGGISGSLSVAKLVELVESRRRKTLPAENHGLDPIWRHRTDLVGHVLTCWHSEDVVEFCGSNESAKVTRMK